MAFPAGLGTAPSARPGSIDRSFLVAFSLCVRPAPVAGVRCWAALGVCILVPLESSRICRFCILEVRLGDAVACILLEMKMKWKYKIAHYAYSDPDSYLSRLVVLGDLVSVPPPPGSLLREPRQAPAVPFTASPAFCRYCVSQGL